MGVRLSHSAIETYERCAQEYLLNYINGWKSEFQDSPLFFGGAIHAAVEVLGARKIKNPSEADKALAKKDPKEEFDKKMVWFSIKNNPDGSKMWEDMRTHYLARYFKSDFDETFLLSEDIESLKVTKESAGYKTESPIDLWYELSEELKEKKKLTLTGQCYYNYGCWLSLRRKGHAIIDLFLSEIYPQIEEVYAVEKWIELLNEDGDKIVGKLDLDAKFFNDKRRLWDFKVASTKYTSKNVNGQQLTIYCEAEGIDAGGYIVMEKKPKKIVHRGCKNCDHMIEGYKTKNCPKCKSKDSFEYLGEENVMKYHIVRDDIDEKSKELIFENISDIVMDIEDKKFPQNRDSCFRFGRKCPFFDYCRTHDENGISKPIKG